MRIRIIAVVCSGVVLALIWWSRLDQSATDEPVNLHAVRLKVEQLQREEKWDAVVDVLDQVPSDSHARPKALLIQARAYWHLSNGPALEACLNRCLELDPNPEQPGEITLAALGTLGDHYLGQERFEEARRVIWRVYDAHARRGSPDPFYLTLLLRTRFESTDPALAVDRLEQFLKQDPEDFESHRALGIYLTRINERDRAVVHLRKAVQAHPKTPRFLQAWLWHHDLVGDHDEVARTVANLPAECDEQPFFWTYRGKVALRGRDYEQAAAHFRRALALEPGRLDAGNLLAVALRKAGRLDEAKQAYDRFQSHSEAYANVANIYAVLHVRKGMPERETCKRLSELCDALGWARESRAWREVGSTIKPTKRI